MRNIRDNYSIMFDDGLGGASEILPKLWLGSFNDPVIDFLHANGIATVLNVSEHTSEEVAELSPNVRYIHIPLEFEWQYHKSRMDEALRAVHALREAHKTAAVLIHCAGGVDRSPCVVYKYMKDLGIKDPYRIIKARRPIVFPHADWWEPATLKY